MYRHAPGTIWRHALARVDRRAARLITFESFLEHGTAREHSPRAVHRLLMLRADLREAARLANRLAYCAGIGWPR